MTDKAAKEATTAAEPQFMIQRIYLKDTSFEAPGTPAIFQESWEPELQLDLHNEHKIIDENVYEVILRVTATVKNHSKVAFIAEVKQAGIFTIMGVPEDQLNHLLGSFCPNMLFPYARQVVTNHAINGSFPQLVLAPINFDMLYMQRLEESKAKNSETTA